VGSVSCAELRLYLFGPLCNPDVNIGHSSLLVVLANCIRDRGFILHNSWSLSKYDPKLDDFFKAIIFFQTFKAEYLAGVCHNGAHAVCHLLSTPATVSPLVVNVHISFLVSNRQQP